jgi:DNA-binding GntR family transcriptional regulator
VIVRPLSRIHLAELFAVRKILEGAAVRMAARNATPAYLRKLEEIVTRQATCVKAGDVKRYAALDDEFHRALYDAVGNGRLVELIFANWELIKQARSASTVMPQHGEAWLGNSLRRHKRILAALKKGGEEAACAAVFENIESSEREIVSRLHEVGWIEAPGVERA